MVIFLGKDILIYIDIVREGVPKGFTQKRSEKTNGGQENQNQKEKLSELTVLEQQWNIWSKQAGLGLVIRKSFDLI